MRFCYNATPYTLKARMDGDWFDAGIFARFNAVLEKEENPKRLYVLFDGYQGSILFYNTPQWAEKFEQRTGLTLHTQ